jgi:outer membrane protein assembly factor BamB
LITQGNKVRSYDPATGKQFWELGPMATTVTTTPVATEETLYVGSASMPFGNDRPLYAIKPGSAGDLSLPKGQTSSAAIAWCRPQNGPSMPSPLYYEGYVYVVYETGFVNCFDAATGKPGYPKQRLPRSSGMFTSSPWAYDGKIFVTSEEGNTFVVKAGPEFKLLGKNTLDDMFMASPAIAGGAVYLRGRDYLYCIRPPVIGAAQR